MTRLAPDYHARLAALWAELGIAASLIGERKLPLHEEARRLTPVGLGTDGRDRLLTPAAASAWRAMHMQARREGIELLLVSAFRSADFQAQLIRNKLAKGRAIEEILTVNAPPGCSEHHSGRAVDIGVEGCAALEEAFEETPAFAWLAANAAAHHFTMSYPRGNAEGYLYEPWHWCYRPRRAANSRPGK